MTGRGASTVQIAAGVAGLVIVAFVLLLATREAQRNGPNFDVVGQPSPPVEGVSYTGERFDLDLVLAENRAATDRADQTWIIVNFFASWCVGCVDEHPDLTRLDAEGVTTADGTKCATTLVGVTFNDAADDVEDFFDRLGGDWPVLVGDGTNQTVVDFSVLSVPETVVIAPSGLVVEKFVGAVEYDELVRSISC